MSHRTKHGLHSSREYQAGLLNREIAKIYGVSVPTITNTVNKNYWRHV